MRKSNASRSKGTQRSTPRHIAREEVLAAFNRDKTGTELARLLAEGGIGFFLEDPRPPEPFRPLPALFANADK